MRTVRGDDPVSDITIREHFALELMKAHVIKWGFIESEKLAKTSIKNADSLLHALENPNDTTPIS